MPEVKFTPTPDIPEPFATPEFFRDCLTIDEIVELVGETAYYDFFGNLDPEQRPKYLADIIKLPDSEQFYAECVYLNHWGTQLDRTPHEDGIDLEYYCFCDDGRTVNGVEIDIDYKEDHLTFRYRRVDLDQPDSGYELQIIDNDNVVYRRQAGQDPLTEWDINCMADDPEYVDKEGIVAFTGNHTNI